MAPKQALQDHQGQVQPAPSTNFPQDARAVQQSGENADSAGYLSSRSGDGSGGDQLFADNSPYNRYGAAQIRQQQAVHGEPSGRRGGYDVVGTQQPWLANQADDPRRHNYSRAGFQVPSRRSSFTPSGFGEAIENLEFGDTRGSRNVERDRLRRVRIVNAFEALRQLVPGIGPYESRITVVECAADYIRMLQRHAR